MKILSINQNQKYQRNNNQSFKATKLVIATEDEFQGLSRKYAEGMKNSSFSHYLRAFSPKIIGEKVRTYLISTRNDAYRTMTAFEFNNETKARAMVHEAIPGLAEPIPIADLLTEMNNPKFRYEDIKIREK